MVLEYYLYDLVVFYSFVLKRFLVGGRVWYILLVLGILSSCCKFNGIVGGGDENFVVESIGVIIIKIGVIVVVVKIFNEW